MTLEEFYTEYDITMTYDLLGDVMIHDPLCRICTPGFTTVDLLENYVLQNMKHLLDILD